MTKVKICGITNVEDALVAVQAGADFIGIIQVPNTPRFVSDVETIKSIRSVLPESVSLVGVFADSLDIPMEQYPNLFDMFQIYADSRILIPAEPSLNLIRCYRIKDSDTLRTIVTSDNETSYLLLDAYHDKALGGTGKAFDWSIARMAVETADRPVILAGGLNPDNVAEAISIAKPFAVDVSSGVESYPGKKDHALVRTFVENAKPFVQS